MMMVIMLPMWVWWTKHDSAGTVSPGPQATWGTWGRFRYVASKNLFVTVSSVNKNVFVYRLPD